MMLLFGSLTCKTVSRMTYTVLVETLNPTHSLTHSPQLTSDYGAHSSTLKGPKCILKKVYFLSNDVIHSPCVGHGSTCKIYHCAFAHFRRWSQTYIHLHQLLYI